MKQRSLIIIFGALVVMLSTVVSLIFLLPDPSVVPSKIVKDANFLIYYPERGHTEWRPDVSTLHFSDESQVLTFTLRTGNNSVVIAQQVTPDSFKEIPGYYTKLLDKLHQYAEVKTSVGTLTLTRPEELKGGQSAVINTNKGTLIFARPSHELTEAEWKRLFNALRTL